MVLLVLLIVYVVCRKQICIVRMYIVSLFNSANDYYSCGFSGHKLPLFVVCCVSWMRYVRATHNCAIDNHVENQGLCQWYHNQPNSHMELLYQKLFLTFHNFLNEKKVLVERLGFYF